MKSNFYLRTLLCLVLILSGFGINKAHADHISSTEMYVDYIGTGPNDMTYRVTMITYRVCIANNLVLFPTVGIYVRSNNLGLDTALTLNQVGPEDTVDNLCPDFSKINSCRKLANTNLPGYVRRKYVDTIKVSGRSPDLKFSWSSCCRLLSFVNGGLSQSFYLEVGINNMIKYDNSSPRYNSLPYDFYCTNQPAEFANDPFDPNLTDSLYTKMIDPQQTPATYITYLPGYTTANPMGSATGYTVNPVSGAAKFTPPLPGRYTLAFRTWDYDKSNPLTWMSYTSRDIVISVLNCTNLPPKTDVMPVGIVGTKKVDTTGGNIRIMACPQVPLSFKVNAVSNNPNGLIYMYADETVNPLPTGMTVVPTVTGGTGYVTVAWTPTAADLGSRVISIIAVDSTCAPGQELVLRKKFTFTVDVRPPLDAGPDLLTCPLGDRPVRLSTTANPGSKFTWTDLNGAPAQFLTCNDCAYPMAAPPYNYTYVVQTDDPQVCKDYDTVVVFIDTTVGVIAPQDLLVVCRPGYVNLQATTFGPAPLANLPCGTNNPITCLAQDQDTATIGMGINPSVQKTNTPFYSGSVYHKYQFIVPKRDLLNAGLYSGTINALAFLHINPTILGAADLENMTISLACVPFEDFPTPITNNSFINGTSVASLASYTLTPNAWNQINFATPYSWDTTTNLLVDICMGPMTTPNVNGNDPVAVTAGTAIQKFDNAINICGGNGTVLSYNQRPVVRFMYCPSPELPFNFTWTPGTFMNDSTVQNPTAYIPRSIDYVVNTIGRNGCRVQDILHIVVPDHNVTVGPIDTVACVNQIVPLRATGGNDGYQWFEVNGGSFSSASGTLSCTDCANPIALPPVTTTYAVVFSNDVFRGNPANPGSDLGCPDTLFTTVYINPLPPVRSSSRDTTIAYGKSVRLYATGASNFTWTPVGSLDDPNSPAPIASPKETTNYIVSGMDSNGCMYRDTVKVVVDYRNNLLIPSAFTPNGDGRNDFFKIVNVSFQRLMEFRVFNRWGQEIYTTTDINSGWDGSWKGIEQAVGNYQYLIRVAYPDGNTETYKGDINLIR